MPRQKSTLNGIYFLLYGPPELIGLNAKWL